MLRTVEFRHFRSVFDARLDLGAFTVLSGKDGSGKTNTMLAFQALADLARARGKADKSTLTYERMLSVDADSGSEVRLTMDWTTGARSSAIWTKSHPHGKFERERGLLGQMEFKREARDFLRSMRVFDFKREILAAPVPLAYEQELGTRGECLAGVLDALRDREPETFVELNRKLAEILPTFDRVLFETTEKGHRGLLIRRKDGKSIHAGDESDGVLVAIAIMYLAFSGCRPRFFVIREPASVLDVDVARALVGLLRGACRDGDAQALVTVQGEGVTEKLHCEKGEVVRIYKSDGRTHYGVGGGAELSQDAETDGV